MLVDQSQTLIKAPCSSHLFGCPWIIKVHLQIYTIHTFSRSWYLVSLCIGLSRYDDNGSWWPSSFWQLSRIGWLSPKSDNALWADSMFWQYLSKIHSYWAINISGYYLDPLNDSMVVWFYWVATILVRTFITRAIKQDQ